MSLRGRIIVIDQKRRKRLSGPKARPSKASVEKRALWAEKSGRLIRGSDNEHLTYGYPIGYPRRMQAKYEIKVQVIRSKKRAPRFYVNFPLPLAAALDLQGGEHVQWQLLGRSELRLLRLGGSGPAGRRK